MSASNGYDVSALFAAAAKANPALISRAALAVSRDAFTRGRQREPLSARRARAARRATAACRCSLGHFVVHRTECKACGQYVG